MNLTFVYPDLALGLPWWKGYYYCGVGSLAAQVKAGGHRTNLIHITDPRYGRHDFLSDIDGAKPDLLAFSATTLAFPWVARCCAWLEEAGIRIPKICGGAHPTVDPEGAIQTPHLDMICIGEGEGALTDLADALEKGAPYDGIRNLWVNRDGAVHRNPVRPLIQDLDSLAPFDRDDWKNFPQLMTEREGQAATIASRGCPFECSYCANHTYRQIFPDRPFVRFRSVDHVMAELKSIVAAHPFVRGFVFDDDILFMQKSWSIEFTRRYRAELGLPFTCNIRPNLCTPETVSLLKEARCATVKIGLESGNDYIRNTVLRRNLEAEDMIAAFHRLEEAGIRTVSFNMVGLPFETPANVLETVKLNARSHASDAQVSIFYPFPGTESAKLCEEHGFIRPFTGDVHDYFSDSFLRMDTLSRDQIRVYRLTFVLFMRLYRALYDHLEPSRRGLPEKLLDWLFTSRILPFFLMKVVRPVRRFYLEAVRSSRS